MKIMDNPNSKKDQAANQGFTLLEVLVAIAIFAVGLLAVASMQTNALSSTSFAQRHTVATAVAQAAMESLLALPEKDAIFDTNVVAAPHDLDPTSAANTLTVNGGIYTATRTIQPNIPVTSVATVSINLTGPGTPPGGAGITITAYKRTD